MGHLFESHSFVSFAVVVMLHSLTARTAQGGGGSFKDRKPIGEVDGCDAWMSEHSH